MDVNYEYEVLTEFIIMLVDGCVSPRVEIK